MKLKYRIIFFLIGFAGLAFMIIQADVKSLDWNTLLTTKMLLLFATLLVLWLVIYIVHTISYLVIIGKQKKKVPFFAMFRICLSGFALNSVTPAGLVGGEPYRIIELKKYCSPQKATSSTLTFTLFYVMGHVMLWLTGTIVYFAIGIPGPTYVTILLAITGVFFAGALTLFFLTKKQGLVAATIRFLARVPLISKIFVRLLEKKGDQLKEIDDNIIAFRSEGLRFWIVLLLQYLSRLLEAVEYYIILIYLGTNINPLQGLLVLSVASLIGNLLFLIPMQAGTREGGITIVISFLGIEASIGVVAGLIYRVRELICIIFGVFTILIHKKQKVIIDKIESTREKIEERREERHEEKQKKLEEKENEE